MKDRYARNINPQRRHAAATGWSIPQPWFKCFTYHVETCSMLQSHCLEPHEFAWVIPAVADEARVRDASLART